MMPGRSAFGFVWPRSCQTAGACGIWRVLSWSAAGKSSLSSARSFLSQSAAAAHALPLCRQSFASVSPRNKKTYLAHAHSFAAVRLVSSAKPRAGLVPERLLIYHAGTGRTTFLACLKVTTVFGLAFFTFLVAPAYIIADKPLWQILGIVSCGIVPFIVASYTSSPFVVFVHLRLPAYARHPDRELLRRFVRNPPAGTQLDFTTMNLVGRPRLATVAISDLAPAHKRLGIVNLIDTQASARQTATTSDPKMARAKLGTRLMPTLAKQASRSTVTFSSRFPFVHLPPNTCFGAPASNNSRSVQYAWVWADLLASIQQRARKPDQNGPKSG